jgi:hypothetical protein
MVVVSLGKRPDQRELGRRMKRTMAGRMTAPTRETSDAGKLKLS